MGYKRINQNKQKIITYYATFIPFIWIIAYEAND